MEFRILGPLEVRDGERVLSLGGAKRRAVLARLLLDANRAVPFDALVEGVWGDQPPAAVRASLRNHAARLRRELGDRLVTHGDGYLLRVGPDELDLERFARLVGEARHADPARRASLLHDALALWRGPALADLAGERWIAGCPRCRSHLLRCAAGRGFVPDVRFATDDHVVVQRLVARGLGVALLPSWAVLASAQPEVVAVPVAGVDERVVEVLVRPDARRIAAVAAVLAGLRDAAAATP